jgi:hypothetical protein
MPDNTRDEYFQSYEQRQAEAASGPEDSLRRLLANNAPALESVEPPQKPLPRTITSVEGDEQPEEERSFFEVAFAPEIELGKAVGGGVRDAAQNYINAMSDLGEWLGNKVGNTIWEGDMDVEINTFDNLLPEVPQPNSVPGQMTRGVTQFLTGFVPAMRAVKYKQAVSTSEKAFKAMAASGISDFFVFDPHGS